MKVFYRVITAIGMIALSTAAAFAVRRVMRMRHNAEGNNASGSEHDDTVVADEVTAGAEQGARDDITETEIQEIEEESDAIGAEETEVESDGVETAETEVEADREEEDVEDQEGEEEI